MAYTREEISAAFERYKAAAAEAGATGNWRPWVECFVPEVRYIEHYYGEFEGRETVYEWISSTMGKFPFTHMTEFPWDWATIDAEQGWVVGQLQNRFSDPGDGKVYQEANWTRLMYAGDGLFASEEDVYNPAKMAPVVTEWLAAWKAHHPDPPQG
jgi:hypothetical protein